MNPQTQSRLFTEYAEFFPNRNDHLRSSMAFGFDCSDGWARLVETPLWYAKGRVSEWHRLRLLREGLIQDGRYDREGKHAWLEHSARTQDKPPFRNLEVVQVKEKFGGLRFYYQGSVTLGFIAVVEAVEWLSSVTCESCGRAGQQEKADTWISTRCEECKTKEATHG